MGIRERKEARGQENDVDTRIFFKKLMYRLLDII